MQVYVRSHIKSRRYHRFIKTRRCRIKSLYIDGIEGALSRDKESNKTYFTRSQTGESIELKEKKQIITDGMQNKKDNQILVIFTGTNDNPNETTIQKVIQTQKKMIEYANTDKYIVIGLTRGMFGDVNEILHQEYGEKFMDFRKYILENGLQEAGLTPTEQDIQDIKNGEIPISLRVNEVHGNKYFYTLLGKQVKDKIIQLDYLTEEQLEVLAIEH